MAILTSKRTEKEKRNAKINKMYNNYMSYKGSQRTGAYEAISLKLGISVSTVGRVVGNIKRKEGK